MHLDDLAAMAKSGIRDAGGVPLKFNTFVVTDGEAMGHEGMKCSLVSREVIADAIELVVRGHQMDAILGHRRLRQDHPRHRHGHGAPGPAQRLRLRRLDPPRACTRESRWTS